MILDEAERAIIQEGRNHRHQIDKMRRHDIGEVKKAVDYIGSITLIDEISRPDPLMYPKEESIAPHTQVSRLMVKELFSKLKSYEKIKEDMQKELERRVAEIDNICSSLSTITEPDIHASSEGLAKVYSKMRSILVEGGFELDPADNSANLDLQEPSDYTWLPDASLNNSVSTCSFDANISGNSSADSYIFPVRKKSKIDEQP